MSPLKSSKAKQDALSGIYAAFDTMFESFVDPSFMASDSGLTMFKALDMTLCMQSYAGVLVLYCGSY